jgi:hypothetical protein
VTGAAKADINRERNSGNGNDVGGLSSKAEKLNFHA